jgi:hypothetical protein
MRWLFLATAIVPLFVAPSGPPGPVLAAQDVLPDAPGRDITVKLCSTCHKTIESRKERLACM